MTWVDIANLRGPQGDQGPVNVGLRQTDPITYAAPGGFTFNLADGGQQTVNIPLATAQSAGLQSAASAYDSGWRNILSLVPAAAAGTLHIRRYGPVVEIVAENLTLSGILGSSDFVDPLGPGWRPMTPVYTRCVDYWSGTGAFPIRVWIDAKLRGVFGQASDPKMYFHLTYLTTDLPPVILPGKTV